MSLQEDYQGNGNESFWEIDSYKRTVRRTEEGFQMCNEMMKMFRERSDIEKEYAKKLKAWSRKWNEFFEKGYEYGTTKAVLKGSLEEADKIANVHLTIKDRLLNEVEVEVKEWKNENYKKQIMGVCKEAKLFEEDFKRAQKPWSKRLEKVIKCKKDYHTACKLEKSAVNQESNAKNSSDVSLEQLRKFQERVDKLKKEVVSTREKYQQSLIELNAYNSRYVEDMIEVFQKTQDFEEKRLNFMKNILLKMHGCIDITKYSIIPTIYGSMFEMISVLDPKKDLVWWSENHGTGMNMSPPAYEEYVTEFHSISNKEKGLKEVDGGILLTLVQKSDQDKAAAATNAQISSSNSSSPSKTRLNSIPEDDGVSNSSSLTRNGCEPSLENGGAKRMNELKMVKGVKVRALYDYEGQEKDELSFCAGDIFLKLRDKDEQGWCTGCKDGRVGLFPYSYVQGMENTSL